MIPLDSCAHLIMTNTHHYFDSIPALSSERLNLREIAVADAKSIIAISVYDGVFAKTEKDVLDIFEKIHKNFVKGDSILWGICLKETDEIIGSCGYCRGYPSNVGEIGYVLREAYRGQGYMTEAAKLVVDFGLDVMKLDDVVAYTDSINAKSMSVLQRVGFQQVVNVDDDSCKFRLGWDRDVIKLWDSFDSHTAIDFIQKIETLVQELPAKSAIGLFERACAQDSTGHPELAVPLYQAALEEGLTGIRRRRATIQMASSIRNLGDSQKAVDILTTELDAESDELDAAVNAFLALALTDLSREREALTLSLSALSTYLPRYNRSLKYYAEDLSVAKS